MNQTNQVDMFRLSLRSTINGIAAVTTYLLLQVLIGISVDFFVIILLMVCVIPVVRYYKSSNFRGKLNNKFSFVLLEILITIIIYVLCFMLIFFIAGTYGM